MIVRPAPLDALLLLALTEDAAGVPVWELLRTCAEQFNAAGGGPLADRCSLMADALESAVGIAPIAHPDETTAMVMTALASQPQPPAALRTPWEPIDSAPKRQKVLVSWINGLGHRRMTCAIWYDAGELAMDDDVPDDLVDAGGDNVEGGWFEDCESRDPSYWPLNETLTHWTPLPLNIEAALRRAAETERS